MSDIPYDVWVKGHEIDDFDSSLWRRDDFGVPMKYDDYGNRNSEHGWEIDHIITVDDGGSDDLSNLRPLNYKSNLARNRN